MAPPWGTRTARPGTGEPRRLPRSGWGRAHLDIREERPRVRGYEYSMNADAAKLEVGEPAGYIVRRQPVTAKPGEYTFSVRASENQTTIRTRTGE